MISKTKPLRINTYLIGAVHRGGQLQHARNMSLGRFWNGREEFSVSDTVNLLFAPGLIAIKQRGIMINFETSHFPSPKMRDLAI